MQALRTDNGLSNMQIELMKLYATDIKDSELKEIKKYLSKYFAQKAIKEADEIWDKKHLDNHQMDRWLSGS